MNKVLLMIAILLLAGCNWIRPKPESIPPVTVITETVQLEIYQPPLPPAIRFDDVRWYVITEENLQDKIQEVKRHTGTDFVLFGMTPQSYENMAYNFQENRRYILQLLEIIRYYREATAPRGSEAWLEQNEVQQEQQVSLFRRLLRDN
jgi:hypothetical protein